jgi:ferrous iron transport protein B
MSSEAKKGSSPLYVALTGNPNSGKTTVFNALTGMRAKVGNYAGVTVERKEGRLLNSPRDREIRVLDLPGTYSLSPQSLDEQISRDVLLNRLPELPSPSLIVVVVDASNLQRNLYYATQVIELGHPTLIALNMVDVAENNGHLIDLDKLSRALGVPIIPVVANSGKGVPELRQKIISLAPGESAPAAPLQFCELPPTFAAEVSTLAQMLGEHFHERRRQAAAEALLILTNEKALASSLEHYPAAIQRAVTAARSRLEAAKVDWQGAAIEARYARVTAIHQSVVTESFQNRETFSDKLDHVLTHKIWGTLIFVLIMGVMFQSIFSLARLPMDLLQYAVDWFGGLVGGAIPPGPLNSLLVDGAIAGVGAVIAFLPQILLLFFFIGLLEDTGYMARAAFLMDRLMSKVGLHGKSFIPMLSSFACAIPGIMATRTIESPKDRLVTILVAPLMSCSARLPVYTLLIGACIPDIRVLGFFKLTGLTMLAMYLLGIIVALLMAWLFKKTLLKGETPILIMELPPYKRPLVRVVMRHMWDRSQLFLRRAGTVILGITILLWFLANYPHSAAREQQFDQKQAAAVRRFFPDVKSDAAATQKIAQLKPQFDKYAATEKALASLDPKKDAASVAKLQAELPVIDSAYGLYRRLDTIDKERAGAKLQHSFAGMAGRAIEPAISPLGFDWKIGIGIISSFAAREVFVSTMSTVYNLGAGDAEAKTGDLQKILPEQKRADGTKVYTPLTAVTLMVFYVFALQCVSTVAVVRRETNSWKWPVFQWLYMGVLAWGLAFATFQGGRLLGWH